MSNREFTKTYTAESAILPYRIVKYGASDGVAAQASAATDKLLGVTVPLISVAPGEPVDVIRAGIADVQLGTTVTRGDLIVSDANGCGITAAPAAGSNVRILGTVDVSGVAGDIVPVLLSLTSFQG
jgi:hypothetical protein